MDILVFVAVVIVCLAAMGYLAGRKPICPMCHTRALKCVQSGKGPSPNWSYHQCEGCGARYKQESSSRGQWISVSDDDWRKDIRQFPDKWRAVTRMRTGFGDIDVWRSEDLSWLRIKQVKKSRMPALLYWTLAATVENVVPADARLVGMLHGTHVIEMKLPATDGFVTIWSSTHQRAVSSFALKDLP
jgi:hypothetical protein